ncbi:MAG: FecR domain-containing protein, partial [Bacteroidota bacterium]
PDGTKVWLNESSQLSYAEQDGERQVVLTGEAYFDVVTDSTRAFRIFAGDAITTVLGTAFNVRAYPAEESVEVTVTEGRVALEEANVEKTAVATTEKRVELTAGKRGVYAKQVIEVEEEVVAPENALAWKERQLNFNGVPLSEVVRDLNHYYNIDIKLANANLEPCELIGVYDNDPQLEMMIQIIEGFGFNVTEEDNSYIISGEGCD